MLVFFVFSSIAIYQGTKASYEYKNIDTVPYTQYGAYTYSASVTQANPLYPVGTVLDMKKPAYFLNVAPILDMNFKYNIKATGSDDITGTIQTFAVASGTVKDGENETIYWSKEFPIKTSAFTVSGNEVADQDFSVNVNDIQIATKSISEQLNYTDDTAISVINRIIYSGSINGEAVNSSVEYTLPITANNAYYQINGDTVFTQDVHVTRFSSIPRETTVNNLTVPIIVFILSISLCALTLSIRKTGKVEMDYIAKLEEAEKYSEFKDSVSKGKIPVNHSFAQVVIDSLKELVDAAVDMNSRVIHDKSIETYFTISDGVIYTFVDDIEKITEAIPIEKPLEKVDVVTKEEKQEAKLDCFSENKGNHPYNMIKRTRKI